MTQAAQCMLELEYNVQSYSSVSTYISEVLILYLKDMHSLEGTSFAYNRLFSARKDFVIQSMFSTMMTNV